MVGADELLWTYSWYLRSYKHSCFLNQMNNFYKSWGRLSARELGVTGVSERPILGNYFEV
jgi:hypothetical protein